MRAILPLLVSLLAALTLMTIVQPCRGYRLTHAFSQPDLRDHQTYSSKYQSKSRSEEEDTFPKLGSDVFGFSSGESFERSRNHEDNDSLSASEEANLLDLSQELSPHVTKRRKGPTLSVVNPLEILRQRLMLDLARRRIHENQQQIVANAQLLENIGKRSVPLVSRSDSVEGAGSFYSGASSGGGYRV